MKGKNTYSPVRALRKLQDTKQHIVLGIFSSTSDYGPLPTSSKIISCWSHYRSDKKHTKNTVDGVTERDIEKWVEATLDPNYPPIDDDLIETRNDVVDAGSSVRP